ncbi:uncharacterized protein BDV17DRAFT_255440 [Aspergillus undulatus]|uniref:uncharacterized protein n=1 Tax=Aspergillus undulatus TaxID=1810928 RepID=UPI003CCD3B63
MSRMSPCVFTETNHNVAVLPKAGRPDTQPCPTKASIRRQRSRHPAHLPSLIDAGAFRQAKITILPLQPWRTRIVCARLYLESKLPVASFTPAIRAGRERYLHRTPALYGLTFSALMLISSAIESDKCPSLYFQDYSSARTSGAEFVQLVTYGECAVGSRSHNAKSPQRKQRQKASPPGLLRSGRTILACPISTRIQ